MHTGKPKHPNHHVLPLTPPTQQTAALPAPYHVAVRPSSAAGVWPLQHTDTETLAVALAQQLQHTPIRIGAALLALRRIDEVELEAALRQQLTQPGVLLGQILLARQAITAADLQLALLTKMAYPFVDLAVFPLDARALRQVSAAQALKWGVLPLMHWQSALVVAMTDPSQLSVLDELEFTLQCKVRAVATLSSDMPVQIAKAYRQHSGVYASAVGLVPTVQEVAVVLPPSADAWLLAAELANGESSESDELALPMLEQSDNTLVRLVNSMISEAHQQRASDIHIEPYPGRAQVMIRFRIDGELRPYLELPPTYRNALVARIKVMSDLDIAERRKPQDGKIHFAKYGGLPLELRVATLPTAHGLEDVVLRLLTGHQVLALDALHLLPDVAATLRGCIQQPHGLLLCVGPTGSGKTTTLHSVLQQLNQPQRKIWTAEDPVEITQHGLRQIQVHPRIGWTFASALRAILRADPDVIMVGEIRDRETAQMAIESSLTGHLVLSTLHTNSAIETLVRLSDLGVDAFSFADALLGVLAQRLVRRWCVHCVQTEPMSNAAWQEWRLAYQQTLPPQHPLQEANRLRDYATQHTGTAEPRTCHAPGCVHCGQTGYRGRVALHECLSMSESLRELLQQRTGLSGIRQWSESAGWRTLRQDGLLKVWQGLTSLTEVRSHTQSST